MSAQASARRYVRNFLKLGGFHRYRREEHSSKVLISIKSGNTRSFRWRVSCSIVTLDRDSVVKYEKPSQDCMLDCVLF